AVASGAAALALGAVFPAALALIELGIALADGTAATLAAALGGLTGLGLGPASRFPWQETRANTRPAAQGTRVTQGSVQAFPRIPRISDASVWLDVTY
ncbi:MAG: hypothetical protein ABUL60_18090, partial [Myxococcales bacterium]